MSNTPTPETTETSPSWHKPVAIIVGVVIVGLLIWGVYAAFSNKEEPAAPAPVPTTEATATAAPLTPAVSITQPTNGAVLDITQPVKVEGEGQALFEGSVVVEAVDAHGEVLAQESAVLKGDNVGAGGKGEWSVELNLQDVMPGTTGQIVVYSPDPASGKNAAETSVNVTFGESVKAGITILEPSSGAVLDISRHVEVKGEGQGLPEANVVVEAVDANGTVLAQQATTLKGSDVGTGGKGEWSVSLNMGNVTPGTPGKIVAYGTDPNGSRIAQTGIDVTFGEAVEPTAEPTAEPTEEPSDPSKDLEGKKWGMLNTLPDTEIYMTFARGTVSGSAGCNNFTGNYQTRSDGGIVISDLTPGRKACDQPIMDQEHQFLTDLASATAFQVQGDQMTLFIPGGTLQFQTEDN